MNWAAEFERRVRFGEQRYRVIFDSIYDGILVVLADTYEFFDANPRMCVMFGYSHAEMLKLDFQKLSVGPAPEILFEGGPFREQTTFGEAVVAEWLCKRKDGSQFWAEVAARRADFDGRDVLLLTLRDTTVRHTALDEVAYRDRLLAAIAIGVAELVISPSTDVTRSNILAAIGNALNADRVLVVGSHADITRDGAVRYAWRKSDDIRAVGSVEHADALPGEIEYWLAPLAAGKPVISSILTATGFVAQMMRNLGSRATIQVPITVGGAYWGRIIVDECKALRTWTDVEIEVLGIVGRVIGAVLSRERDHAQLDQLSRYDELTGLPNRRLFTEVLEKEIARVGRAGPSFGVLLLNLDHFKDVDDTLGRPVANRLLQLVAERLAAAVRTIDTVARFGADDFAALEIDARNESDLAVLAENLVTVLSEPYYIDGNQIRVHASLGVSFYGPDSLDADTLLSHAHVALYRAKSEGGNRYSFFTKAMDTEMRARVALEKELSEAVTANEFYVEYQPQVDTRTSTVIGLEALVRWRHPTRGIVSPALFIPAAEKTGLIVPIGSFVLREVCMQIERWIDAGIAPPVVAVNVSVVQFQAARAFSTVLEAALSETGVDAHRLELELTESVIMVASVDSSDGLLGLRKMGCRIAIDDFGNGYSSLDYLRRFPVDRIKIPQNFTAELCTQPNDALIVRSSLDLAHHLGIEVMMEGVETAEQLETLKSWGCRFVQGFYYSKPLSPEDATALLRIGHLAPNAATPLALAP